MFAAIVEAGKLERALDLVERLHLEKSFEIAMAIADNHRKLVDFIEDAKERRFPILEADDVESPSDYVPITLSRPRISPDNTFASHKRTLQDTESRHVRSKQSFA
jgi:siroheme synthase (precorrin-2 oxidase/ferrochelatase)